MSLRAAQLEQPRRAAPMAAPRAQRRAPPARPSASCRGRGRGCGCGAARRAPCSAAATTGVAESGTTAAAAKAIAEEVAKRVNYAIIAHPDAGKTTLTEKMLLYGGALREAGEIKGKGAEKATKSDWMDIEQQRGISVTASAMVFEARGKSVTLLDTPGHKDFSEDTYRSLAAADNALMLVDAGKGLEPQTHKLFEVCRMRRLPMFTFFNKLDRPAIEPLELLEEIEREFGMQTFPVVWPLGSGDRFAGVVDRLDRKVHLYTKSGREGKAKGAVTEMLDLDDDLERLRELVDAEVLETALEEVELLDEAGAELDMDAVMAGELTPCFFGAAINNFGVELLLNRFLELARAPASMTTAAGDEVSPSSEAFSGFVFKLQANMDKRHRDKIAFVRVCSGRFERGMKATVARTGRSVSMSAPQKLFAEDRETIEEAYAGDVIGLNNPDAFAIGDTVYASGSPKLAFPPIPMFSPELFAYLRLEDPGARKAFAKGVEQLLSEGCVQVLRTRDDLVGAQAPILAAVGELQFDVVLERLKSEYGVKARLDRMPYTAARWVKEGGWEAVEAAGDLFGVEAVADVYGRPVLLFKNAWAVGKLADDAPDLAPVLLPYSFAPSEEEQAKLNKAKKRK